MTVSAKTEAVLKGLAPLFDGLSLDDRLVVIGSLAGYFLNNAGRENQELWIDHLIAEWGRPKGPPKPEPEVA